MALHHAKHATGVLLAVVALSASTPARVSTPIPPTSKSRLSEAYGKLPLRFEANHGQTDGRVKFLSRGTGYGLYLTATEAVVALGGGGNSAAAVRMKLAGSNPDPRVEGIEELPGRSHYFVGSDPSKWRTGVPSYRRVRYESVYPGVDLVYYGNQRRLEYDLIVAPGADPKTIALEFEGAEKIAVASDGDLVLTTSAGELRQQKPFMYQEVGGARREVAGGYRLEGDEIGFEIGAYDRSLPLVIDPVLIYSTFLGGSGSDVARAIAADASGNAYVIGETLSTDFPSANPQRPANLRGDVFVTKLDAAGSTIVYFTYLGGSGGELGNGIAVDSSGNAYVTGSTVSADFPTVNPIQPAFSGGQSHDAFVAKLNAAGSALVYSTYLGGSMHDIGKDIAVDSAGSAYVTGSTSSTNFPTFNPIQAALGGSEDAFIAKLNAAGTALVYSTYLGGSAQERVMDIGIDSSGNAYLAGDTPSPDFPTVNALQAALKGAFDGFVAKLNAAGSALVYSTYLGGSNHDFAICLAVDASGNAYVGGETYSSDFPTFNPLKPASDVGAGDGFVAKLNPSGSAFVYSTFFGGSDFDSVYDVAVDSQGNAWLGGFTSSLDFPAVDPFQPALVGSGEDLFVARLNAAGWALTYASYLGGTGTEHDIALAVDAAGNAYAAGGTGSPDFPVVNPLQPALAGEIDGFVLKIGDNVLAVTIDIKPREFPNSINLGSGGSVPVAIFSSATFDARTVDPLTVTLAGAQVKLKGKGTPQYSVEHVDNDGRLDLIVHVSTEALQLTENDTQAVLNGMTSDGTRIRGTDSVRIVP